MEQQLLKYLCFPYTSNRVGQIKVFLLCRFFSVAINVKKRQDSHTLRFYSNV